MCLLIAIFQAYNNSSSFLGQNAYKKNCGYKEKWGIKMAGSSVSNARIFGCVFAWLDICLAENFRIWMSSILS